MFWLLAICLTLVAIMIGFRPLIKRVDHAAATDSEFDTAVYRDQLAELEADKARGSIDAAEYEQARVEVARRIIAVENRDQTIDRSAREHNGGFVGAVFAVLFVPGLAFLFYVELGSPGMDAQPLAARVNQPLASEVSEDIALMLERAEEHLRVNPDDVRGWDVVAPVYLQTNRFDKAITAYNNAISLDGTTTNRLAGLGEAMVSQNGGIIDGDALIRFQAAMQLNPDDARSNFFIALAAAQAGNLEEAQAIWQELSTNDAQARWARMAETALARLPTSPTVGAAPQLDEAQRDAVAEFPVDERNEMIVSMVEGLNDRLQSDPNDLEGWLRLIRARTVLGQPELAVAALKSGIRAFSDDDEALQSLNSLALELGIPIEEEGS